MTENTPPLCLLYLNFLGLFLSAGITTYGTFEVNLFWAADSKRPFPSDMIIGVLSQGLSRRRTYLLLIPFQLHQR